MAERPAKERLASSRVFVCVLTHEFEGSDGEEMLELAIKLGKPVILLRPTGAELLPTPRALATYGHESVTGDPLVAAARIREYLEVLPGEPVSYTSHEYGQEAGQ